jgi:hypothetical protein
LPHRPPIAALPGDDGIFMDMFMGNNNMQEDTPQPRKRQQQRRPRPNRFERNPPSPQLDNDDTFRRARSSAKPIYSPYGRSISGTATSSTEPAAETHNTNMDDSSSSTFDFGSRSVVLIVLLGLRFCAWERQNNQEQQPTTTYKNQQQATTKIATKTKRNSTIKRVWSCF